MSITFLTYAFLTKSSKSPASIAKSKRASERLLESSTKYLEEKLKLTVNREKLNEILTGYLHYYGITDNSERITAFRYNVMKSYNFKYQGRSRSLIFKYSTSLKDILNRNSVMGSFKSALPYCYGNTVDIPQVYGKVHFPFSGHIYSVCKGQGGYNLQVFLVL